MYKTNAFEYVVNLYNSVGALISQVSVWAVDGDTATENALQLHNVPQKTQKAIKAEVVAIKRLSL